MGGRRDRKGPGRAAGLVASAVAVMLAVATATGPAGAVTGNLDLAFAAGGTGTTDFGGTYDWACATVLQPDGRIIAGGVSNAGGTHDFALARYTADGRLDPTFGDGGTVTTDFGGSYDWIHAAALQPDGRIVVGGVSDQSGSRDFALARYHSDGSLDPTFGVGGIVTTNFENESYDEPYAVVLQPDGGIVLGGVSNTGGGIGRIFGADNLALARYLPTGLLDPSFGDTGKVVLDAGSMFESIRALALDPAGRIVAAGRTSGERRGDLLMARFGPDGRPDPGFGTTAPGLSITDLGTAEEGLTSLALGPDGTIIAGGIVAPQRHGDLAVMRYDSTGRFDRGFAGDGLATADMGGRDDRVRSLALQPDGNVVLVGSSETDFVVARFTVLPLE